MAQKASVFVHPSLIFAGKVKSHKVKGYGLHLSSKYKKTKRDVIASEKHSFFLHYMITLDLKRLIRQIKT